MKGYCLDCGQIHLVSADTQAEADNIATEKCDCESEAKWHRLMEANVEMLCGEKSKELNFSPVNEDGIELIKRTCELIHAGFISSVKINVANSDVVIKSAIDKVDIKRVRKQTNQLTI